METKEDKTQEIKFNSDDPKSEIGKEWSDGIIYSAKFNKSLDKAYEFGKTSKDYNKIFNIMKEVHQIGFDEAKQKELNKSISYKKGYNDGYDRGLFEKKEEIIKDIEQSDFFKTKINQSYNIGKDESIKKINSLIEKTKVQFNDGYDKGYARGLIDGFDVIINSYIENNESNIDDVLYLDNDLKPIEPIYFTDIKIKTINIDIIKNYLAFNQIHDNGSIFKWDYLIIYFFRNKCVLNISEVIELTNEYCKKHEKRFSEGVINSRIKTNLEILVKDNVLIKEKREDKERPTIKLNYYYLSCVHIIENKRKAE